MTGAGCTAAIPVAHDRRMLYDGRMGRAERRAIATAFLAEVNARTVCAHCGKQPVEWHNPDHVNHSNARVSSLRTQGASIARIKQELEVCTPLCRTCHMVEDGRMGSLRNNQPYQKGKAYVSPKPCTDCGKMTKPTRRGRCNHCYIKFTGIR